MTTNLRVLKVKTLTTLTLALLAHDVLSAQQTKDTPPTKFPGLDAVYPITVPVGKTTKIKVITNGNVTSAHKLLLEGSEITATVLPPAKGQPADTAEVEIKVSEKALAGIRELQLATKEAITSIGRVMIVPGDVSLEGGPNETRDKAEPISFPTYRCGMIDKALDVDWFVFDGKKGERVNFNLFGSRLHDTIHKLGRFVNHFDAKLTLFNEQQRELASNNDFYFADPMLTFVLPADGKYFLRLQDVRYAGSRMYSYALHATKGLVATHQFPAILSSKQATPIMLLLTNGEWIPAGNLKFASSEPASSYPFLASPSAGKSVPTMLRVGLGELPITIEPLTPNTNASKPVELKLGTMFAGRIRQPDEADLFSVNVTKGENYLFRVIARRVYSLLDARLELLDQPTGRPIVQADDTVLFDGSQTKDPELSWQATKTGTVYLRISDLTKRGGSNFTYHLSAEKAQPDYVLTCDPSLMMVGPGNRTPLFVRATKRFGFDAPIKLEVKNLPAGVTANPATIVPGQREAMIVLSVATDAKLDARQLEVMGSAMIGADGNKKLLTVKAVPLAEVYQARRVPAKTLGLAITESSDIRVTTTTKTIKLEPGQKVLVPVKIERLKYTKGTVVLSADWRYEQTQFGSALPIGVKIDPASSKLALNGSATEGVIALQADSSAQPVKTTWAAIASVPIEFSVAVPFCTEPISLSVVAKGESTNVANK